MHEETRRFVSRMLNPIVAEFKREVEQQRANSASEADTQEMLDRIESVNRAVVEADQLAYLLELFREAASASIPPIWLLMGSHRRSTV
jgi:hypothetical protein